MLWEAAKYWEKKTTEEKERNFSMETSRESATNMRAKKKYK